jgi:hypothetical protein
VGGAALVGIPMTPHQDLVLFYVQRRIQRRELPETPADQLEVMSEVFVGLIVNGIVWTFVAVLYFS